MEKPSIEFLLRAFDYNKVHTSYIILKMLKMHNYGYDDLEKIVTSGWNRMEQEQMKRDTYLRTMSKIAGVCPECKRPLSLRPIVTPKGSKNVHGYKTHWFCSNEKCQYEKYEKKSIEEFMKVED